MLTLGRFRPAQAAIHAFCLFVGIRGLISGPVQNSALRTMYGGAVWLIVSFYIAITLGAVIAIIGEIIQLKQPLLSDSAEGVGATYAGIAIELSGCALMSMNLVAFSIGFFFTPEISESRSIPFIFLGLGIFFRACQCYNDMRRIRNYYAVYGS